VNGAPAPVVTADVLLRAVAIPPGMHEVVFSYRTPLLVEGGVLSAVGWLALIAALAWARRSVPRNHFHTGSGFQSLEQGAPPRRQ
jgi:hypothetical protein